MSREIRIRVYQTAKGMSVQLEELDGGHSLRKQSRNRRWWQGQDPREVDDSLRYGVLVAVDNAVQDFMNQLAMPF